MIGTQVGVIKMEIHTFFFFLNLATIPQGALKGAVNAVAEFAKQHPRDAAKMGLEIAKATGVKPKYGGSFAGGFLETADFTK